MSNQPETNETPATGYTPAPRKSGLPRFFDCSAASLWAFYRASFLCLLGFLPVRRWLFSARWAAQRC